MAENISRIQAFKNKGKDSSEMRRRRNEVSVQLRKSKRDENVLKRRNITDVDSTSPLKEHNNQHSVPIQILPLPVVVGNLQSGDDNLMFTSVQSVRKMLSKEKSPPIDDVINAGLIPMLVKLLDRFDLPLLQFEAAWALTNIASGTSEQTKAVQEGGAVPMFVKLLSSVHDNVAEQAVWALGNIAGDGPLMRNTVIACGALGPLLALIKPSTSIQFLRNVTWTLSNLCRNKNPPPDVTAVQQVLPAIARLILSDDKEVLADTCWALSYLTDGVNERIQLVLDSGVVPKLVELLGYPEVNVLTPALRAIGNIVTGRDDQTQAVIDTGALFYFRALLTHKKSNIIKEAAWAISNVTAGTAQQIQAVMDSGLVPLIVDILRRGDFKARKEAIWVITNYCSGANPDQVKYLLHCDVIPPLCEQLKIQDQKDIQILLDGLKSLLASASKIEGMLDDTLDKIEESEGIDHLEKLQENGNKQIYLKAKGLIERYFSDENIEEENNLVPEVSNTGFQFAPPQSIPATGFNFGS
ncbi:predicted protein [Nematostella vectensis]|uniref:Importin subunit alpha n=1 Tax=Nematostella vectensis TaxID=45351 RepID=A7T055_NEMVE|nr:predicted protein [Nematostella vectensis]|eukprot:XP_001622748.1 predicted protein [Nematostella vectensis]